MSDDYTLCEERHCCFLVETKNAIYAATLPIIITLLNNVYVASRLVAS